MFSDAIFADVLRQISNPKVTSLSNHLALNSSWGTLYVASIDKITYAHNIIISSVTAQHITLLLLQHYSTASDVIMAGSERKPG